MRLSAIFGDMGGFKRDLMAYAVMGVGVVGSIAAYNFVWSKLPVSVTGASYAKYLKPAGAIVLGIVGGNLLARKVNANIGQGFAVGLTAAGLLNLAGTIPGVSDSLAKIGVGGGMNLAGLRGMRGMRGMRGLRGAPIQIEQVRGAPTSVQVAGFGRLAPTLY